MIESGSIAVIYAVFTTSVNAISGSAICAYNVDDIMEAFQGRFKSQRDSQSQWLPIQEEQVPVPRPGQCAEDSRTMSSIAVNFIKNHPLMEMAVSPVNGRPLLTKVHLHQRWTTIAVDSQVRALDGEFYDVIYAGTDDGKVTKFFNIPSASNSRTAAFPIHLRTVLISEMQVLPNGIPVRELTVSTKTNTLLVVSDGLLITVPLHHCNHIMDCVNCLALQDPSCAWDHLAHECINIVTQTEHKFSIKTFSQSLNSTVNAAKAFCPNGSENFMPSDSAVVNLGALTGITLQHHGHTTSRTHHHQEEKAQKYWIAKLNAQTNKKMSALAEDEIMPGMVSDTETGEGSDARTPTYLDRPSSIGSGFLLDAFKEDNKITLHSVNAEDLMGGGFNGIN